MIKEIFLMRANMKSIKTWLVLLLAAAIYIPIALYVINNFSKSDNPTERLIFQILFWLVFIFVFLQLFIAGYINKKEKYGKNELWSKSWFIMFFINLIGIIYSIHSLFLPSLK